jgi:SAM-dependent methyltransferase
MTQAKTGTDGHCLLCGERGWTLVSRTDDKEYHARPGEFDIVRCWKCGHVYLNPLPAPEEVAALYPPTYYTVNPNSPLFHESKLIRWKMGKDARDFRARWGDRKFTNLIDIGCGDVKRIAAYRDAYADCAAQGTAFDLLFSDRARALAKELNVECREGNIETDVASLPDNGYDLAFMRQLIEHLRDPRQALLNLRPKLKPGALLVIDTPNVGGMDFDLFHNSYWAGFHTPRHFHLFNQASLTQLVQEAGFKVVDRGYLPSIGFWIISLRVKFGLDCVEEGGWPWRHISLKNIAFSGGFTVLDTLCIKLGLATSNQFVVAVKE